jgi:hypothetical protein
VGEFFLDLFCDGIVNCFSAETLWAPMLGGPKNRRESPTTWVWNKCTRVVKRRQRISESLYSPQKLGTPLHVPSHPLL